MPRETEATGAIMSILEVIHLRLAGEHPDALVDMIQSSAECCPETMEIRVFRHSRVDSDLAIHLHHRATGQEPQLSRPGLRLAGVLREYGLVEHSVWIDAAAQAREAEDDT